ncbi:MAG: hypothetical protein JRE64_13385 [Deltaproteobacteria bacterium]|nr:hypothetical protein [Deltaproteobacteria bacterium]
MKIITDDEFNHLRSQIVTSKNDLNLTSQIVISNDNLNLKSQFTTSSWGGIRKKSYTFAEPHIRYAQNNSPEFEGIRSQDYIQQEIEKSQQDVGQISSLSLLLSEKPIAKQAAAQLVQIPWGQNITKNLPGEFGFSLPSIEEIEAELSGAEESQ